jgi:hypothetical protein
MVGQRDIEANVVGRGKVNGKEGKKKQRRHWSKVERYCDSNSEAASYIPPC